MSTVYNNDNNPQPQISLSQIYQQIMIQPIYKRIPYLIDFHTRQMNYYSDKCWYVNNQLNELQQQTQQDPLLITANPQKFQNLQHEILQCQQNIIQYKSFFNENQSQLFILQQPPTKYDLIELYNCMEELQKKRIYNLGHFENDNDDGDEDDDQYIKCIEFFSKYPIPLIELSTQEIDLCSRVIKNHSIINQNKLNQQHLIKKIIKPLIEKIKKQELNQQELTTTISKTTNIIQELSQVSYQQQQQILQFQSTLNSDSHHHHHYHYHHAIPEIPLPPPTLKLQSNNTSTTTLPNQTSTLIPFENDISLTQEIQQKDEERDYDSIVNLDNHYSVDILI